MLKIVTNTVTCFKQFERGDMKGLENLLIFLNVSKYICLLLLMGKFVYVLVKTAKLRRKEGLEVNWLYEDDTDWRNEWMYTHVKEVFKKHRQIKTRPNILVAVLMALAQKIIATCFFLHNRETLAVDNRRPYHIFSYFVLYFNIFNILLGLVTCILRIIFGMILGVIFLQRLAKSTLPRSYEKRDPGYMAYVGFILMEHQHSNPVLQCFVRLLLETQGMKLKDESFSNPPGEQRYLKLLMKMTLADSTEENVRKNRRRRRNRWHLFTTLSLNPSIIKYRIRFLDAIKIEKSFLKSNPYKRFENIGYEMFAANDKKTTGEEVVVISETPTKNKKSPYRTY